MTKYTKFRPRVRSKNHSCDAIRHMNDNGLGFFPFKSVVRFGSRTPITKVFKKSYAEAVEINTVEAVENSRSKLKMKEAFKNVGVSQSMWWNPATEEAFDANFPFNYPIVAKRIYGFKGKGMAKLDNKEQLENWLNNNNIDGYYFEEFKNYTREYRLHCTKWGCFYAARKMIKSDTPDDKKWFRNDSNCVWITEYTVEKDNLGNIVNYNEDVPNELFDKPVNWDKIESDCVKALKEVGLDVGAFDVKVQSATNNQGVKRDNPEYIIIEVNSAPSFGQITTQKYKEILPELLTNKYEENLL